MAKTFSMCLGFFRDFNKEKFKLKNDEDWYEKKIKNEENTNIDRSRCNSAKR